MYEIWVQALSNWWKINLKIASPQQHLYNSSYVTF